MKEKAPINMLFRSKTLKIQHILVERFTRTRITRDFLFANDLVGTFAPAKTLSIQVLCQRFRSCKVYNFLMCVVWKVEVAFSYNNIIIYINYNNTSTLPMLFWMKCKQNYCMIIKYTQESCIKCVIDILTWLYSFSSCRSL